MARKKKPEEGSSGAYWMDTYGDMITLVLTFFVLLFSFSTLDAAKWEALVANLSGSPMVLVSPLDPGGSIAPEPDPKELEKAKDADDESAIDPVEVQFDELYKAAMEYREDHSLESLLVVERFEDTIMLRFMDSMLFDSGRADLKPESVELLQGLFNLFEQNDHLIKELRVEGHTDTNPINTARFRDNWDLSAIRASTVVRTLAAETTINPIKFSVSGYGDQHPIDTNETEEGRARNRRVDIVIQRRETDPLEMIDPNGDGEDTPSFTERPLSERTQQLWDDITN